MTLIPTTLLKVQTSYLMVDEVSDDEDSDGQLEDDTFGNINSTTTIPHTVESFKYKELPPTMPTNNLVVLLKAKLIPTFCLCQIGTFF